MVRQLCGDFIYLVILLFLGGSYLDINSNVDMANTGLALPGTALIYICCAIFIENIQLQCQKWPGLDGEWSGHWSHRVRCEKRCLWTSCESWQHHLRFLGRLTWTVTMVNEHFAQSYGIRDVRIPTSVFFVNSHLASAWVPSVTTSKVHLPSASEPCP